MKMTIRRQVRLVINNIANSQLRTGFPELDYFIKSSRSKTQITFWIIFVVLVASISCYQIKNRIDYFFTYPISVTINVDEPDQTEKLEVKFCHFYIGYDFPDHEPEVNQQQLQFQPDKHEQIVHDVYVIQGNGSKHNVINDTNLKNEISYLGRCTVVDVGKHIADEVVIHFTRSTQIIINEKTEGRMFLDCLNGKRMIQWFWFLQLRKYKLYNSPVKPCVPEAVFKNCVDKCVISEITKQLECRYFAYPNEVKLPSCDIGYAVAYESIRSILFHTDPIASCGCVRACNRLVIELRGELYWKMFKQSMVHVKTNSKVIYMNENIAYDEINLVTDIAGSIALFLGLTILSISDVIITTLNSVTKKFHYRKVNSKSRLYGITSSIYHRNKNQQNSSNALNQTKSRKLTQFAHVIIWTLCSVFSIFMIQNRIRYCLSIPIRHVIELDIVSKIRLPSLTICTPDWNLDLMRQKFAQENKLNDWCKVDLLDLLNFNNNTDLDALWNVGNFVSTIARPFPTRNSDLTDKVAITNILTHHGVCHLLKFKNDTSESEADYIAIYYRCDKINANCSRETYPVYIDHPTSNTYSIINEIYSPIGNQTIVDYQYQQISHIRTKSRPCTSITDYKRCKDECLIRQLHSAHLCKLPFLPPDISNGTCNSPSLAKRSREIATGIMAMVASGEICNCVRSCTEDVILFSIIKKYDNFDCSIVQMMSSSVIVKVIEVVSYTIMSLVCDIGNSLGIALGVSILTLLKLVHQIVKLKN